MFLKLKNERIAVGNTMPPAKSAKNRRLFLENLIAMPPRYRGRLADMLGNSSIKTLLPIRKATRVNAIAAMMTKALVT